MTVKSLSAFTKRLYTFSFFRNVQEEIHLHCPTQRHESDSEDQKAQYVEDQTRKYVLL